MACNQGHTDCVKVLLSHGAPLSTKPDLIAKLSSMTQDMAREAETPDLLHQAIATELEVLQAAKRQRTG